MAHLLQLATDDVKKNVVEGDDIPPVPCEEWLRRQFAAPNPWANVSCSYTQRFNTKMSLQTRNICKYHIDHKYGSILFKYLKEFAVIHRQFCMIYFLDDKCTIPIGAVGNPASSVQRQRAVLDGNQSDSSNPSSIEIMGYFSHSC